MHVRRAIARLAVLVSRVSQDGFGVVGSFVSTVCAAGTSPASYAFICRLQKVSRLRFGATRSSRRSFSTGEGRMRVVVFGGVFICLLIDVAVLHVGLALRAGAGSGISAAILP